MSAGNLLRRRVHAARVVAGRHLLETMIGPGIWIVASCALLSAHVLVTEFAVSVEAGGFNPVRSAVYRLVYDVTAAAFGEAFFDRLFAEGPFVFAYSFSFGLLAVFLASGSVSRLALERRVGAMELVCYGPADGTSCLLGALARDLALMLTAALVLLAFLRVLAWRYNLAMGQHLLPAALALAFLSFGLSSIGLFCAAATTRTGSAVALFAGILLLSGGLIVARYAAVTGTVRTLVSVLSGAMQWLSPFFYWDLAMRQAWIGLPPLSALSALYLTAAHLLMRSAGPRPW